MNRTHAVAKRVACAVMLGTAVATVIPIAGVRVASAQDGTAQSVADEYFRVDFSVSAVGSDADRITGYVYNRYGDTADQVQLRVTALDAAGRPGPSYLERIADSVPPFDRMYFDLKVPGHAAAYSVTVESWNFTDGRSGRP